MNSFFSSTLFGRNTCLGKKGNYSALSICREQNQGHCYIERRGFHENRTTSFVRQQQLWLMKSVYPNQPSSLFLSLSNFIRRSFHFHLTRSTPLDPTSLNCLLNAVSESNSHAHAYQIHAQLLTSRFISVPFLFNNLLNLYAKAGRVDQASLLFSTTHGVLKNVVSWTSLITRLSHSHRPFEALILFSQMRGTGVYPNHFTFSAILPACADTTLPAHGEQMHCLIRKQGFETDVFVASALLIMYAKCSVMNLAQTVFDEMPLKNLVSWNSMLVGYLQNHLYDWAIWYFRLLLQDNYIVPDQVSYSSVLSACANIGSLEFGKQVHGVALKYCMLNLAYITNSLMDMYGKCGLFDDVLKLFQNVEVRDVVSWNVIIMGCVHNDNCEEACNNFWSMRMEDITPDEASYSSVLHACARLAALNQGTLVHDQIIKTGNAKNVCVGSSLITMYAKCGSLIDAYKVFEEIKNPSIVCWTSIIAACQQHGHGDRVINLFEEMLKEGIQPDYITFVSVLSACSHTRRVEEGFFYFNSMSKVYGIIPGHEHFACIVDLLGRAGQLVEAKRFVESMPIKPDSSVWGALLGACRNFGDLKMGKDVAMRLFELEPDNPGNYVLLSNMFMRNGMSDEANEVRRLMGANGVRKEPGCSWIDVKNSTFVFTANDKSHARTNEICQLLDELKQAVKKRGYVAETQFAINSAEGYKEQSLWHHSEKLALAFGVLGLPAGAPIRIKKNLRTCGDCHTVMKFASEIFSREIIVRDINRFHHFANGQCSCRDYW